MLDEGVDDVDMVLEDDVVVEVGGLAGGTWGKILFPCGLPVCLRVFPRCQFSHFGRSFGCPALLLRSGFLLGSFVRVAWVLRSSTGNRASLGSFADTMGLLSC